MSRPKIQRVIRSKELKATYPWPKQSPFQPNDSIELSNQSVGKQTKTCPVNSSGETIFRPEWYHGRI